MKIHPLSKAYLRLLGATLTDDAPDCCIYQAERHDRWSSTPWGGFFVGPIGVDERGLMIAATHLSAAEAIKDWLLVNKSQTAK